jgi:hypothetical protein
MKEILKKGPTPVVVILSIPMEDMLIPVIVLLAVVVERR